MRKLQNFAEHGCYCEQKIAYNIAWSYCKFSDEAFFKLAETSLSNIADKYDKTAIRNILQKNIEIFRELKHKNFTSYKEIANIFYF